MQFYRRFISELSNNHKMDWKAFFQTRNRLKIIKRISGAPSVVGFWIAESSLLSLPIFNPAFVMKYVDPIIAVGGCTIMGSICAYMLGGAMAEQAWRWFNPKRATEFNMKLKNFSQRIQKHRANVAPDPTRMNLKFDFYGEKIKSISDYKYWLKQQRDLLKR